MHTEVFTSEMKYYVEFSLKTLQQRKKKWEEEVKQNNRTLIILRMVDGYTGVQHTTSFICLHV